jgi:tetratricopeptide (TPR) repeat protein
MANRSETNQVSGDTPVAHAFGRPGIETAISRWSTRDWLLGSILVLALFLAYQPVWLAGFIWDDDSVVTGNPVIIGPLGLKEIWTTHAADICPLVLTTFWVEHALWGLNPLPYHLVNIMLHAACAILLWRVLLALQIPGAWLGAALWALHPVQVQTAAWITEMKNTQSGLFYLLSILFFIRALKAQAVDPPRSWKGCYGLTLLFAALAMASKSSTVVLPIVLGLCAWWVEGRWQWRNAARLAPIALMAIVPCALTLWTQKLLGQGPETLFWARSWPERVATAGGAIWFYLGKLLWPHPLVFIYPRWAITASSWISYLPLLAAAILLVILWRNRETWVRPCFFAFAYFVGALLPVLGLVDGFFWRYSLVGDHFQYLASMGPLALFGAGLTRLAEFALPGKPMIQSRLAAGLLLVLGMLSWQRTWVYENLETLWTDTLAHNPTSWMAHNNLGDVYLQQGKLDAAKAEYQNALAIDPQEVNARSNLGIILAQQGRPDAAIIQFQEALKIRPNFGRALNNLAATLQAEGRLDEALAVYQEAEPINPYYPQIHFNLGNILLQKARLDAARAEFQKALDLDAADGPARQKLGIVLLRQGHFEEAIAQFQQTLRLQPDDAETRKNLAAAEAALAHRAGGR